jgi:hypothetical protein
VDKVRNPGVRTRPCGICSRDFRVFQRGQARLLHRAVPAIPLATQAGHKTHDRERASEIVTRVPTATVTVEQEASMPGSTHRNIQKGVYDQIIKHAVAEAVAMYLTRLDAHHYGHGLLSPISSGPTLGF